jgi:ParB-like chromosome segregation protein Spo0J
MQYTFHEVADIFPLMQGEEFSQLVNDIRAYGLREPIWIYQDKIIDGRNRYLACEVAGIEPEFREWNGDGSLVAFVVSLNLHRRHLDESQRSLVAAKIATLDVGRPENNSANLQNLSQPEAAALLNVSTRSVASARKVLDDCILALVRKVERGEMAVSTAADLADLSAEEQAEILAQGEAAILFAAKDIRQRKRVLNAERRLQILHRPVIVPEGKYRCIVIDPPWPMEKIERDERPNQVGFDYPTMGEEELLAFPVPDYAADDCHLSPRTAFRTCTRPSCAR